MSDKKRDIRADGFVAGHAIGFAGFVNLPENPHPLHTPERHTWVVAYGQGRSVGRFHRMQMEWLAKQEAPLFSPLSFTIYGKRVGVNIPATPDMDVEELDRLIWNLTQIRIAMT
jgi:hypothetical protein